MPLNDNDKPFVAAIVALVDKKPAEVDKKLFEILKGLNAIPFAAIVQPFPGYGKLVKAKYDKMQVMARATRLKTGASGPDELNVRNVVWSFAMAQAIGHAVLSTIFTTSIDDVQILLDEKSMRSSERALFTGTVKNNMDGVITDILGSISLLNPGVISEWKNRVQFSAKTTSINWSDESEKFKSEFGLKLADRLSRKLYRSQTSRPANTETILRDAGFDDSVMDITEVITRLDQRIIDNFKRNTGLPEPREL